MTQNSLITRKNFVADASQVCWRSLHASWKTILLPEIVEISLSRIVKAVLWLNLVEVSEFMPVKTLSSFLHS